MRAAKVDANHGEIVETLRALGASVQSLATVGDGCPDILVGWRGRNTVLEIKDGDKPPSARKLTPREQRWSDEWKGQVMTVMNVMDAVVLVFGGGSDQHVTVYKRALRDA